MRFELITAALLLATTAFAGTCKPKPKPSSIPKDPCTANEIKLCCNNWDPEYSVGSSCTQPVNSFPCQQAVWIPLCCPPEGQGSGNTPRGWQGRPCRDVRGQI